MSTSHHTNEIILPETDEFSKRFNECSEYFIKSQDETLSIEEREFYYNKWYSARQSLELGIN